MICDGFHRFLCARCGLEDTAEEEVGAIADATGYAAGDGIDGAAGLRDAAEARTVFKSLASIDAHDGKSQFGLQLMEDRFARTNGQAADGAGDDASDGVSLVLIPRDCLDEFSRIGLIAHLYQFGPNGDAPGGQ